MPESEDSIARVTQTRSYLIYGERDDVTLMPLGDWEASTHEAALKGWGEDNPAAAIQYTRFLVVTASSAKQLSGGPDTRFVVRPR